MLLLADLSGIQTYLFLVRETGGKQAAALRFRSLYIQLVSEALAIRLLQACGLGDTSLLMSAAGKIAIDVPDEDGVLRLIEDEFRAIEEMLCRETHGRLRLSYSVASSGARNMVRQFNEASRGLQRAKLRSWSLSAISDRWQTDALVSSPPDTDSEAERDAQFGRSVVQPDMRFVIFDQSDGVGRSQAREVLGLSVQLGTTPLNNPNVRVRDLGRLARHIPTHHNRAVEFVDLARQSAGAPMLGVLKADADYLGMAVSRVLQYADDLEPLRKLSERLEHFFSQELDQQMRDNPRWSQLYTVFSGGDDILLVGPWDIALDFAAYLREAFVAEFDDLGLTISAGLAIVKPRFPIRLAADEAENLLHRAKEEPAPGRDKSRDQFATMGSCWHWSDHRRIIDNGKQLADWVEQSVIQRGWLQTLLSFMEQAHEPMTAAHMAYHIGRNWPAKSSNDARERDAREMADALRDMLDKPNNPAAHRAAASLRYAILATRHSSEA